MAEERRDVCVGEVNMVELDTEFLKKLEEQAIDRYTENDKNFLEVGNPTFDSHFFSHAYANLIFSRPFCIGAVKEGEASQ